MAVLKSKSSICLVSSRALQRERVVEDKSSRQQRCALSSFGYAAWFANQIQTSDMIVMVLDATKRAEQRALLEAELEAVGIRLNQEPPNIYLKPKKAGGVKITFQTPPKHLDEKMLYNILKDYRILNCEVLVRDEEGMFEHYSTL